MEPEEQIYVNLEELADARSSTEKTETPERAHSVAEEETETWSFFKAATVCLGLLCFLLLTAVIGVGVLYGRDLNQLSRELANHTAEKHQLLARYQNLTDERDQLQTNMTNAVRVLTRVMKSAGTCPDGWRKLGCRCYFLSAMLRTWEDSRQQCLTQEANLVIVNNREEMVLLNKLGAQLKFWIGLSKSSRGDWRWTDGKSLGATNYFPSLHLWYPRTQGCAAFNSFQTDISERTMKSWSAESCAQMLRWVCEKEAVLLHQPTCDS